jgi:hypothetical protein
MHNRDEKYEGSDEPEYHFSDEESGEYADTELPKEVASSVAEPKAEEAKTRFTPSKRMIMSLCVFLALVYVVYKMVAPTSQTPATDITAANQTDTSQLSKNPAMQQTPSRNSLAMNNAAVQQARQQTGAVQGQPMMSQPPQQTMPQQQNIMPQQQQVMPQQQNILPQQQNIMPQQQQIMPQQQQGMPQQGMSQQIMPQQQVMSQQVSQPNNMPQQAAATLAQQGMAMVTGMPSVIAVPAPTPMSPYANGMMGPMQNTNNNEGKIAVLQNDASKLMGELQSNYAQKLNDFSEQNKALQDQIQTLNSRMMTMETQMSQLIQALTHQDGQTSSSLGASNDMAAVSGPQASREPKTTYNVQAIIPGRAWLRTDNGDTLTVAEGDVIKSLGRVTKIDPYDGVVEINTGNKTLSLSYGTST